MRKQIILVLGLLMAITAFSQKVTIVENFDGDTNTYTSYPASAWKIDTNYYVSTHNSIRGVVPNMAGSETFLETSIYDLTGYDHVMLRFKHICKVSPMDAVRIEYKTSGQGWQTIPVATYMGKANLNYYGMYGFNAGSYPEWEANDSLAIPLQSWWKEELFDVSVETELDNAVQFRFVIQHGNTAGTQISYGWLIDNIEIIAANHGLYYPIVEFVGYYPKDTVYSALPYVIEAKVRTATNARIYNPWLKYTATHNGTLIENDSILMTMIAGDSLWKATMPLFALGTEVIYFITGKDTLDNYSTITSSYVIVKPKHNYGDISVSLTSINSPVRGQTVGGSNVPVMVTIYNKGDSALTSVMIHWSINGVIQQHTWTGNLLWDMTTSINLGNYIPRLDMYDTITVWVSNPNNSTDPVLSDDTLRVISYGCSSALSGTYTVGNGGMFPSISSFISVLGTCSPVGDVTLLLLTGIYNEATWNFFNLSNFMGNYTLTVTSAASHADSVILQPLSNTAISLNNTNNFVLKDITVDATLLNVAIAVGFTGACTNVVIRDCKLLVNPINISNSFPISKGSSNVVMKDISIINNLLDGGSGGIQFYGGTTTVMGKNIIFDSNIISNSHSYGMYIYYTDITSCSHNTILSRETNTAATWYTIYVYQCNGSIIGNRIKQRSNLITRAEGIRVQYFNYNTTDTGLIVNNEIILNTTGAYPGIISTYSKAKILHNSVYVSGSGAARGIQIADGAYAVVVKSNNIIMESTDAFPIYLSSNANLNLYDIDYNNIYAPNYVGYAGGDISDMSFWQQIIFTDNHSIRIRPEFIDSTVNLEISDYFPLRMLILPDVDRDIEDNYRISTFTSIGCYHGYPPFSVNAALGNIDGFRTGVVLGQQDVLKVELFNTGATPLTTATLNWSINGVTQSTAGIPWSGTLLPEQSVSLTVGTMTYTQKGNNIIKVWIVSLGASLQDEYHRDDTVSISGYICQNTLSGNYTIGNGGTFSTWDAAMEQVKFCGLNGDVVFEFLPDTYNMYLDLGNSSFLFGNYTLTITSSTRNAEDVIFKTGYYGISLNNSNHIVIDAITIDAIQGTYGIQFTGACTNVVIRNCKLLSGANYRPIFKNEGTGTVDSIFFINNLLDGGTHGFYFCGGIRSAYGTNIVFDSNIVSNQSSCAVWSYYNNFTSCSYNTILGQTTTSDAYLNWKGIWMNYGNGPIIGNRIIQRNNTTVSQLYGIELYSHNNMRAIDTCLIANNEIILNANGAYNCIAIGIQSNVSQLSIIHNSIYMSGTGSTPKGINMISDPYNIIDMARIKNNNIIIEPTEGFPIYLNSITNLVSYDSYDIDYNNMYAPKYVGYAGIADTIKNMTAWQQVITTDQHSVRVLPNITNPSNSLEPLQSLDLLCNSFPTVNRDIRGGTRTALTTIGCYEVSTPTGNGMLQTIIGLKEGHVAGQTDTIKAVIINRGSASITSVNLGWSVNDVIQNNNLNFPISLLQGQSDTVFIGQLTYTASDAIVKVWINSLNGGSLSDAFAEDDTASATGFLCPVGGYKGLFTVGATGNFKTLKEALTRLNICGISGDITLAFQTGTYIDNVNLTNSATLFNTYSLTLTSVTGNAADVTFSASEAAVIQCNNTSNLIIKNITIDATQNTHGILLTGTVYNVTVDHCIILSNQTTTVNSSAGIYKSNIGSLNGLTVKNCTIDGSYYGIYLVSASGNYYQNIIIDSNTFNNQAYYAISLSYTSTNSISYNTFSPRQVNATTTWRALNGTYLHNGGNIISNRVSANNPDINATLTGFYFQTIDTALIANNEIYLNSNATTTDGIYVIRPVGVSFINNSIYTIKSGTTGTNRAHYNSIASGYSSTIKNNLFVAQGGSITYALYFEGTAANYNNFGANYKVDYNNYYSSGSYIGYVAGGLRANLTAWRTAAPLYDSNSVNIMPAFINPDVNLELANYPDTLFCPIYPGIAKDIKGRYRSNMTIMGAYIDLESVLDLEVANVICKETEIVYTQAVPVEIGIINKGRSYNINSATFGWSINGELQPPYQWIAGNPLIPGANLEITIGSFSMEEKTNVFDIVVWIENVNGIKDSVTWNDTARTSVKVLYTGNNLSIRSIEPLVPDGLLCTEDYTSLKIVLDNTGTLDYDFDANPVTFSVRITNPEPFTLDTIVSTGEIKSGETAIIELTDMFPIIVAGMYDIEVFFNILVDTIKYDDTVRDYYLSGRLGLPIDEDFSSTIPTEFTVRSNNASCQWQIISKGLGADTVINPQFGTGMLSFGGSAGSMATLSTRQMDLSQTIQPSLSFWYFHDTIPSEDYTDVRITIDGGASYNTLYSLTKYDAIYGWKQYSADLPAYAVNQCVILVFEAMEKSRTGDVTQYIDRILITARQDIAITGILTSPLSVCDLENKDLKVVMQNLSNPVLNYVTNPTILTLEVKETGYIYDTLLSSGTLGSFASDTITMATGFNFAKGNYTLKAYFSSVLDVDRNNDTLESSIVIDPALSVSIQSESTPNCLAGEIIVYPTVILNNTGNMDLSDIDLILQIDTGDNNPAVYALFRETYTGTILAGDSAIYIFTNAYSVPWNARYDVRLNAFLNCDSVMANATNMIQECVDVKDLRIVSIDNPTSGTIDDVGSSIQVRATLNNRSDGDIFNSLPVTYSVTNSQGVQTASSTENINIGLSETVSHTFNVTYTVPNDTVYYLIVYIENRDNYRNNDTMTIKRETNNVGVETLASNVFTLGQNIPNPAKSTTRIDYSIPEAGEIVFHVQSVSGQLLYSKTIEATNGANSLEFNTSTLAAGIYVYSIEYKGQRLIKRMSVQK